MAQKDGSTFRLEIDRRTTLQLLGASALTSLSPIAGLAAGVEEGEIIRSHGYSFFGDLKYPADYQHFDYVNPNAPVGGQVSVSTRGTFDGMNRWNWQGKAGLYSGLVAEGMFGDGPFGTQTPADSITEQYGLIAEAVEYPASKRWCVFHMRPEAKFSDGTPLTAHDAAFTHDLFLDQAIRSYARAVKQRIEGYEIIDDHTIKYNFVDGISRRSLISQVGSTPVFSKDWYERTGERLDKQSWNIPLGSGPYVLDSYEANRFIVYKRNPDYWGWHLPINKGRHNFDSVKVEYFADDAAEFEAFKAGLYTFRAEGSTKKWATGYNFPAVEKGYVKLEALPDRTPPTPSGFVFNFLREPFTDVKVREALALAFNFEWTSASLQYGLTTQRHSFSENSEVQATGVPEGAEKAFLESLGDVVPAELFTEEAVMAHTSNPDRAADRRNKRRALKLLEEAGWTVGSDGKLRDANGELMQFKIMLSGASSDTTEAIITTYVETLKNFGVTVEAEKVDTAQYAQRYYDKDWDMMFFRNQPFEVASTGLKQSYGSETAVVSSYNPQSIQDPLIDAIIEQSLLTNSRDEEIAALQALDRALRFRRIQIPAGYVAEYWVAYYDMYEHPEELPPRGLGYLDFWWFNQEKYEALKAAGALRS
ncbi:extracellular solute-binding protein [Ruegeria sp.]|uniref:extracellular solute-binding protein n=1 Tax=Ruegeria sp. TaxID=1879320 RepID=UPI003C798290